MHCSTSYCPEVSCVVYIIHALWFERNSYFLVISSYRAICVCEGKKIKSYGSVQGPILHRTGDELECPLTILDIQLFCMSFYSCMCMLLGDGE